jgi:hypothetical protein
MATRGGKPKPDFLRLVNPPSKKSVRPRETPVVSGKPKKPAYLRGRPAELWTELVAFCPWLTVVDGYKMAAWCILQTRIEELGSGMLPTMVAQWRILGCELGLDPSSRTRMPPSPAVDANDPAARFLNPTAEYLGRKPGLG